MHNPTGWRCAVSYSKELRIVRVVDWIQIRNSLVPCIPEVNNRRVLLSKNFQSEVTANIEHEAGNVYGPHLEIGARGKDKKRELSFYISTRSEY